MGIGANPPLLQDFCSCWALRADMSEGSASMAEVGLTTQDDFMVLTPASDAVVHRAEVDQCPSHTIAR